MVDQDIGKSPTKKTTLDKDKSKILSPGKCREKSLLLVVVVVVMGGW